MLVQVLQTRVRVTFTMMLALVWRARREKEKPLPGEEEAVIARGVCLNFRQCVPDCSLVKYLQHESDDTPERVVPL
ncbi:hypothetical protein WH50_10500 [Pokkaliibacter plantistimulans]|uniref:Secreted protein n=1 Tax=Pokkaliibacter plantistimulans TaxID=1635171 RepID=A0ABX5LXE1_9GAMM|nr:hypothetical protein WH50_10500 [Pokkaliibacter plantistimulans]